MHEQVVTPWDVQGSVSTDGSQQAIDYDKLVDQFGTRRIDDKVLERFEKLIGCRPHIFLRRGLFFSHRLAFCYFFLKWIPTILLPENSTEFLIDTNKENLFIYIREEDPAVIACI